VTDIFARIRATLDATGAPYEMIECDPALSDTADFCAHYGYALEDSVNTILMKAKGSKAIAPYVACALLGNCRLDTNHTLRQKLEARKVSFASAQETREITGMELGGVTAFGLPAGLPLWVDTAVMERETLIFGSGERQSKIVTGPKAVRALSNTVVVDGLASPDYS
jgi:prolyl-tRNA editing enzyme YbaK/EbsC (Cys-tRNA(Pro) deacylase)